MGYIRDGRAPIPESEKTSRIMSTIRAKNTKPELKLRMALRDIGIRGYRLHWNKAPGKPDIALPGKKIAIFIHGCFWHRCPICEPPMPKTHIDFWENKFNINRERDAKKIYDLETQGWKVFVFWECEINKDARTLAYSVKKYLDETKSEHS